MIHRSKNAPFLPNTQLTGIERNMPMRGKGELAEAWRQTCYVVHESLEAKISESVSYNLREKLRASTPTRTQFMNSLEGWAPFLVSSLPTCT